MAQDTAQRENGKRYCPHTTKMEN